MYFLFYGLAKVDVSFELLELEEGVTINPNPGQEPKVLMTGYPLSFLRKGIYQTNNTFNSAPNNKSVNYWVSRIFLS